MRKTKLQDFLQLYSDIWKNNVEQKAHFEYHKNIMKIEINIKLYI